jgi:hypothetical protein
MKTRWLAGWIGAAMLLTPLAKAQNDGRKEGTSADMRAAIQWEQHKDAAAARQARLERLHPSVTYDNPNSANRTMEEPAEGRSVKDPGPPQVRRERE